MKGEERMDKTVKSSLQNGIMIHIQAFVDSC